MQQPRHYKTEARSRGKKQCLSTQIMKKLHVCLTGHISSPNEVEEARLETEHKQLNNKR